MKDDANKKPKSVGLLIGIGGGPKGEPEGDDYDVPEEEDNGKVELQTTAARAILSALKGNDPEALREALNAFMEC